MDRDAAFRARAIGMLVLFGIQFVAGMVLNLFVTLPNSHPGRAGDEYFSRSWASLVWALSFGGGWSLFVHAVLGCLIAVASVAVFVAALAQRARGWRWAFGLGALFTVGAFFNGMSFLDYGEDFSSAIMAGGWLGAVVCMIVPLVRRGRHTAPERAM